MLDHPDGGRVVECSGSYTAHRYEVSSVFYLIPEIVDVTLPNYVLTTKRQVRRERRLFAG